MNDVDNRLVSLLKDARRQLELERRRRSSPIAVIGIGCRFPGGASNPAAFWRLLREGIDASSEVPGDRWDLQGFYDADPEAPGKAYTKRGSFLANVDSFEPEFFGISPREALGMDPQQRLLLEVVWEALEDAGIPPSRLRGTATGVWVGLCIEDYARRSLCSGNPSDIDAYSALGNTRSIAAGRISYVLDLRGPAVQLDTACSSSLVAIHQACQSLRMNECDVAIVGGVNLMLAPESTIALCKLRALSPDGRCKTFDAAADGYGRGEGCGIVVLKRLEDATAAGDRVYASLRGSAVNHDGQSNGLTAPNGLAQEAVIRMALAQANVAAADVSYVETHGTGTLLGDPIEVHSLSRVYGTNRPSDSPLYLGAVKTNFGHLEGAAGIAGLIKVALCLSNETIPPLLHFRQPNPKLPWAALPVRVPTEAVAWRRTTQARFAGISSFGISGTNAHVVLEEAPVVDTARETPVRSAELVVISAKTPAALMASAGRLKAHVENQPELALGDIAFSLMTRRVSMERRLALAVTSRDALLRALPAATETVALPSIVNASKLVPKVVFVFPGQGSQWLGMGRQLLAEEPVFRAALDACDRAIHAETGWSVVQELGAGEPSRLERVDVVQPVLFALQVALAALWQSWGVVPNAVVGHSMGEVAAAVVAGALDVEGGAAVICRRSRLLRKISGQGAMALVELSIEEAQKAIAGFEDRLGVAVSNSSRSTVLSGASDALAEILAKLESQGIFCRRVKVDVASHSPQVDPLLGDLSSALAGLRPVPGQIPMHSTVVGKVLRGDELGAQYWVDNLREPVRFARTVQALLDGGCSLFVEASPHPLLVTAVEQIRQDAGAEGLATGSLRRDQPERLTLLESLGALHAHGLELDPGRLYPSGGRRVDLPTYPWQRQRYWAEPTSLPQNSVGTTTGHPLLGRRLHAAGADAIYETVLSSTTPEWLADHRLRGRIVVAGAALAELLRAAAEDSSRGAIHELRALALQAPLVLPEPGSQRVQVIVTEAGARASVYSQSAEAPAGLDWTLHATAELSPAASSLPDSVDVAAISSRCNAPIDITKAYDSFSAIGLEYGPAFQGLQRLWRGRGEALAHVAIGSRVHIDGYGLHPALLDAALQSLVGIIGSGYEHPLLPFEFGRLQVHQLGATSALVHARLLDSPSTDGVRADVTLVDPSGALIAQVLSVQLRRTKLDALSLMPATSENVFYHLDWRPTPAPARATLSGRWLVVSFGEPQRAELLARDLRARGAACDVLPLAHVDEGKLPDHVVCAWDDECNADSAIQAAVDGLAVVQGFSKQAPSPRLWWITRAAVAAGLDDLGNPALSTLWGLGRTVLQEYPEYSCTLVDVDRWPGVADVLARELAAQDSESQVAWRNGQRHVARLVRAAAPPHAPPAPEALPKNGTVLITGGLGALGMEVARRFAQRGITHLLLTGRRGLETPGATEARAELEALGCRVTVAAVDVADRQRMAEMLAEVPVEYPLIGVVHAAVVLDDGVLADQTPERFARVLAVKVAGAWNLHGLTKQADLRFFLMFSSATSVLGSAGQSAYAAGNAFLDALASHRRAQGLVGSSVAWGPWSERGLAAQMDGTLQARLSRLGIGTISLRRGSALIDEVLERPEAQLVVTPLDLRLTAKAFGRSVPSIWRALIRAAPVIAEAADVSWKQEIAALPARRRKEAVSEAVLSAIARILSLGSASAVPRDQPLKELGLDSLMALELRNALGRIVGKTLPATLVFDHPTAQSIANHLLADVLEVAEPARSVSTETPSTGMEESIAIVGIGCRYPGGVTDMESFWQLLDSGVDAVSEIPNGRWDVDALYDPDPDAMGKMTTRSGAFLPDIDRFDAEFFGISPREAQKIDPQQRLLLETTWEALESSGLPPHTLMDSNTGVYVGLMYQDYASFFEGAEAWDGYVGTGSAGSVASGRISYTLGLRGPSITVDTACSSSLVTLHLACQALRARECSLALAGGVTLMLTPHVFVEFSRLRGISPDGRCRTFSSDAAGTGWAEGCGMLVLERLSDALANGHPVLAVVRGTAVNQDGRSNGLTSPSGSAQQAVIREALRRARVSPADVDYVECHGTATALGDPIEVQALADELAVGRSQDLPLIIGSVKTNFGHSQAAAGVAGVIKTVLAMRHRTIPKSLHFTSPNPHIAWRELHVKVASEALPWFANGKTRIAGVSSFGISGTNAHAVIEEAPTAATPAEVPPRAAELCVLSAKSAEALTSGALRLREHLEAHPELPLGDVALSLAKSRSLMDHRLALVVPHREALLQALGATVERHSSRRRRAHRQPLRNLAWLFTGQGSQQLGMGQALCAQWPAFSLALNAAFECLNPHLAHPLQEVMWAEANTPNAPLLDQTEYTQPALFALEWALAALWQSWGVHPDVLAGHSIGEITAACVAGVFTLADAARLVCARGRLMQALPPGGAMLSIAAGEGEVLEVVDANRAMVALAAVNGPASTVISGDAPTLAAIAEQFARRNIQTKRLTVSHAFHSPLMDPMLVPFQEAAASIAYHAPVIPIISNLSGELAGEEISTPGYWVRHVREVVRFSAGVHALAEGGAKTFIEIGPRPALLGLVSQCLRDDELLLIGSLRRGRPEPESVLEALGDWVVAGGIVDWDGVFPNGGRRVTLPSYAWQRKRHWIEGAMHPTSKMGRYTHTEAATHGSDASKPVGSAEPESTSSSAAHELTGIAAERRPATMKAVVEAEVVRVLAMSSGDALPMDRPLADLGLDSMQALELRSALNRRVGIAVPGSLMLGDETVERITEVLTLELGMSSAAAEHDEPPAPVDLEPTITTGHSQATDIIRGKTTSVDASIMLGELLHRARAPRGSIVCFPDAGGASAMFMPFAPLAAVGLDVHVISPGRRHLPSQQNARAYVDAAVVYIRSLTQRPYVIFGHSLGAAFAWSVIQELMVSGVPLPELYFPSACPPAKTAKPLSIAVTIETVLSEVAKHTLKPPEQLVSFRQDVESDLRLWTLMSGQADALLPMPIAAFVGQEDSLVSADAMRDWKSCTRSDFSLTVVPGGHFYPHSDDSRRLLIDLLVERLHVETSTGGPAMDVHSRHPSATLLR